MDNTNWVCTDPDTNQYGRQISENEYEFKQDVRYPNGDVEKVQFTIDLREYSEQEQEDMVSSYGYTLESLYADNNKDEARWLIAECIFELEII